MLAKHQPWVADFEVKDMRSDVDWNMWGTRQWPFNQLSEGDEVVYVSRGGPARGRLMWTARITNLVTAPYVSHEEAWELLRQGLPKVILQSEGVHRRSYLSQPDTRRAPNRGWLLAWEGVPIRWLDLPRPHGFRFRPNGWGKVSDEYVSAGRRPMG